MELMEYHRTFQIGQREAMDFYLYQAARHRALGAVGFRVVGLLICWLYSAQAQGTPTSFAVSLVVSFVAVLAAILGGYYFTIRSKVRAAIRQRGREQYPQDILINGFGLRCTANGREVKVAFEKIREVRETKKAVYIYMTENDAGFTTGTPWLKVNPNYTAINAAAQMEDPAAETAQLRKIFDTVIESARLHLRKGDK